VKKHELKTALKAAARVAREREFFIEGPRTGGSRSHAAARQSFNVANTACQIDSRFSPRAGPFFPEHRSERSEKKWNVRQPAHY
jgi:hypothetical protein